MKRLWPHTLVIVAAILLAIIVGIYLCTVRGWLGAPECCCCGHVDGTTHKIAASAADAITMTYGTGSTPTTKWTAAMTTVLMWVGSTSNRPFAFAGFRTEPPSTGALIATALAGLITTPTANDVVPEPVDVTGELGDGGITLVDTGTGDDWWDDEPPECTRAVCGPIVSSAPEPETWIDMIAGIAIVGGVMRLRAVLV